MTASPTVLPHILFLPSTRFVPGDIQSMTVSELRSIARNWVDGSQGKLNREDLEDAFRAAAKDPDVAARVVCRLSLYERKIVEAYRRYGGLVESSVIQLDLKARRLLKVVEKRHGEFYVEKTWDGDPFSGLVRRGILIQDGVSSSYYSPSYSRYGPGNDMDRLGLHPGVAALVRPAEPPGWTIPPATDVPVSITRRSVSDVVLDISRVYAWLSARGSAKVRASGHPAAPTLKSLAKAVPLASDRQLDFPEPEGLYFDILRRVGAIRIEDGEAIPDPATADRLFRLPPAALVHALGRGWLFCRGWSDGVGATESQEFDGSDWHVRLRHDLCWALASLVHAGDHWYELSPFIAALYELGKDGPRPFYLGKVAWAPGFPEVLKQGANAQESRALHAWYDNIGTRYASMLMVSLVALGLVERGQFGTGSAAPWGFRLTGYGTAVFGAPEIPPPAAPDYHPFLLVQPNFDVVAYLDQASPRAISILSRIAENDSTSTGSVQTVKITQARVYQALESGLRHEEIVGFLTENSQRDLPRNLIQSLADWSGKRESLAVRSRLTLLGFPTSAQRDAHLEKHPGGEPCGAHFLIMAGPDGPKTIPGKGSVSDHLMGGCKMLTASDDGELHQKGPPDILVEARLRRIAQRTPGGWKLTRESIRRATDLGLKPERIVGWLEDHLAGPTPPMVKLAIDAWTSPEKGPKVALAEAVLLHIPDPDQYQTLRKSTLLAPYILGSPGPHWLQVKPALRQALEEKLRELGLNVDSDLDPAAHEADAGTLPQPPSLKGPGRPRGRPKRTN
jgi:Helicase conserved C-terminal domain